MNYSVLGYLGCMLAFYVVESGLFLFIFSYSFQKKSHFAWRLSLTLLSCLAFLTAILFLLYDLVIRYFSSLVLSQWIGVGVNLALFGMMIAVLFVLFDEKASWLLYAAVAAEASRVLFTTLYGLFCAGFSLRTVYVFLLDPIDYRTIIFYGLSYLVVSLSCYFLFSRSFAAHKKDFSTHLRNYMTAIFILVLIFVIFFDGNIQVQAANSTPVILLFDGFEFLFALLILLIERFMLVWSKDIREKAAIDAMNENYKKQEEILQKNMDIINVKCHDLKHQIGSMMQKKNLDETFVQEVKSAIAIYDSNVNTGNADIDAVLMEKSLQCHADKIDMLVMIDGAELSFLRLADINAFFGNAIDNAIERLRQEKEENRFLRLSSRQQGNFLVLQIENYCSTPLRLSKKGLPLTSKKDTANHGFGTLSMRETVESYGGEISFRMDNDVFELLAIFNLSDPRVQKSK